MITAKKHYRIKDILKLGGTPGYVLIGYYIVNAIFSRGKLDATAIDFSAIVFMIYSFICFGVGSFYLFTKTSNKVNSNKLFLKTPIFWFVLYTILGFISTFWSLEFRLTIFRSFECLSMVFLMMATLKQLFKYGLNIVIHWSIYYIFISILICFLQSFFRGSEITLQKGGVFQSNQMLATIFFFLGIFHAKKWYMKYTIAIFAVFSLSTTGYIGMALGLISLAFGNVKYKIILSVIGLLIIVAITFIGTNKFLKNTIFIDRSEISMESTSGRNEVWELGYEWFKEKPLTGYGFVAGETYLVRNKEERTMVIGMHNSFMSALVDEGIFGFIFLLFFFIGMFKITFSRYIPVKYRPALIACFLASFVHSMGNPGIGFRVYGSWMSAMFVCILICYIYIENKHFKRKLSITKVIKNNLTNGN